MLIFFIGNEIIFTSFHKYLHSLTTLLMLAEAIYKKPSLRRIHHEIVNHVKDVTGKPEHTSTYRNPTDITGPFINHPYILIRN